MPASDHNVLVDIHNFKFQMNPPPCQGQPVLFALVHSAPNNTEKRLQIRKTWGSILQGSLLFVLGEVDSPLLQVQHSRHSQTCHWVSGSRHFEGTVVCQNIRQCLLNDAVSHPRRLASSKRNLLLCLYITSVQQHPQYFCGWFCRCYWSPRMTGTMTSCRVASRTRTATWHTSTSWLSNGSCTTVQECAMYWRQMMIHLSTLQCWCGHWHRLCIPLLYT
jgi:hypothetical protein